METSVTDMSIQLAKMEIPREFTCLKFVTPTPFIMVNRLNRERNLRQMLQNWRVLKSCPCSVQRTESESSSLWVCCVVLCKVRPRSIRVAILAALVSNIPKIWVTGVFNSFERNWFPWCLKKGIRPAFAVCFCVDRPWFFGGCPWSSVTSVRRRQDPVLRGSSWRWEDIHRQVYCRGLSSILG